jgi:WD40 repeat protein
MIGTCFEFGSNYLGLQIINSASLLLLSCSNDGNIILWDVEGVTTSGNDTSSKKAKLQFNTLSSKSDSKSKRIVQNSKNSLSSEFDTQTTMFEINTDENRNSNYLKFVMSKHTLSVTCLLWHNWSKVLVSGGFLNIFFIL